MLNLSTPGPSTQDLTRALVWHRNWSKDYDRGCSGTPRAKDLFRPVVSVLPDGTVRPRLVPLSCPDPLADVLSGSTRLDPSWEDCESRESRESWALTAAIWCR